MGLLGTKVLPWVPKGRFKQLLITDGKGCRDREEQSRNNSVVLGHCLGSTLRDIYNSIFEIYITETPTQWKMFQQKGYSSIILQTTDHKTTWSLASGSLEDWKDCRPCMHQNSYQQPCPLLNYKTHNLLHPRLGYTIFEGTSLQCPPLSDKAIKLFVSTSPKTLPPRFDSALVYRGQVLALIMILMADWCDGDRMKLKSKCWLISHLKFPY